jgi:hypothetical protein
MSFSDELELLLRACYPLIYIPTLEEERLERAIAESAGRVGNRSVYIWDFVAGYQDNPNHENIGRRNPLQALEFVETLPAKVGAVFILRDFHRFLEDRPQTAKSCPHPQISTEKSHYSRPRSLHSRRSRRGSHGRRFPPTQWRGN